MYLLLNSKHTVNKSAQKLGVLFDFKSRPMMKPRHSSMFPVLHDTNMFQCIRQ